jgi:hypothetical protein
MPGASGASPETPQRGQWSRAQGETDMPLVIDAIGLGAALAAVVGSGISRT